MPWSCGNRIHPIEGSTSKGEFEGIWETCANTTVTLYRLPYPNFTNKTNNFGFALPSQLGGSKRYISASTLAQHLVPVVYIHSFAWLHPPTINSSCFLNHNVEALCKTLCLLVSVESICWNLCSFWELFIASYGIARAAALMFHQHRPAERTKVARLRPGVRKALVSGELGSSRKVLEILGYSRIEPY